MRHLRWCGLRMNGFGSLFIASPSLLVRSTCFLDSTMGLTHIFSISVPPTELTDPTLCPTISATSHEKPVTVSSSCDGALVPESSMVADKAKNQQEDGHLEEFEEVTLLEGVLAVCSYFTS